MLEKMISRAKKINNVAAKHLDIAENFLNDGEELRQVIIRDAKKYRDQVLKNIKSKI